MHVLLVVHARVDNVWQRIYFIMHITHQSFVAEMMCTSRVGFHNIVHCNVRFFILLPIFE